MIGEKTRKLVYAALFAALTCVMTMIVKIPVPATGGYVNLGDCVVLLAGWVLGPMYGGAAAAVFEEFGRLVAMKYFLGSQLEKENALMYGVGHGGVEALFVGGLTCVSNLATVSMVNGGKLESALAGLDEAARATSLETISQLWTLPAYLFYMVGVERLIAFALQICLSYLVYRAVRYHRRGFFLAAMGIHFAVDALAMLLKDAVPIPALEAILAVIVIVTAVFTVRLYRRETEKAVSD